MNIDEFVDCKLHYCTDCEANTAYINDKVNGISTKLYDEHFNFVVGFGEGRTLTKDSRFWNIIRASQKEESVEDMKSVLYDKFVDTTLA